MIFSAVIVSAIALSALAVPVGHRHHQGQAKVAAPAPAPAPAPAAPQTNAAAAAGGVDPALVPPFGIVAGTNPDGHGNCEGVNGILIPCACPPALDQFLPVRVLALSDCDSLTPSPATRCKCRCWTCCQ